MQKSLVFKAESMIQKILSRLRSRNPYLVLAEKLEKELLVYPCNLDEENRKRIFNNFVTLVEFEPHSFCNRQCSFCPNSRLDRNKRQTPFDFSLYEKIITELSIIGYKGRIRFARYCEPLACKDMAQFVSTARRNLPHSNIDLVTNGDYLDADMYSKLKKAGLSVLRISIYPGLKEGWTHSAVEKKVSIIGEKIGRNKRKQVGTNRYMQFRFLDDEMEVLAEAHDLKKTGYDRGQSVKNLVDNNYNRISPCLFVFHNITIDYNGAVMPCCNFLSDINHHKKYIIDFVSSKKSIVDIYFSEKFTYWRRSLVNVGPKDPPCSTCKQKSMTDAKQLKKIRKKISGRLDELGVRLKQNETDKLCPS